VGTIAALSLDFLGALMTHWLCCFGLHPGIVALVVLGLQVEGSLLVDQVTPHHVCDVVASHDIPMHPSVASRTVMATDIHLPYEPFTHGAFLAGIKLINTNNDVAK